MRVRVEVAPDLLRWAVERAGWDATTTARRAPRFDAWTSGRQRPTLKQLQQFATATHTPFGLLFLPTPPVEHVPIPDMRTMGNAGVAHPSANLLDTIYLCQARQDWYRAHAQEHGAARPEFLGSATTAAQPEIIADHIRGMVNFGLAERDAFGDWQDALRGLIDRIEALGVLVMVSGIVGTHTRRTLDPAEFGGFALSDPLVPLIFVNGADTKAAQIFTLIHELGHVWLGVSAVSDAAMTTRGGLADELWCSAVAAEVLVPLAVVRDEYRGDADTGWLDHMERKYRVSTLVVLKRLSDGGFLGWDDYRVRYAQEHARLVAAMAAQRERGGGNYYHTQPRRLSRCFAQAVIASALEGTTTFREAYHLLGTKKHATFENLAAELAVA